jgi:hypothetical protein
VGEIAVTEAVLVGTVYVNEPGRHLLHISEVAYEPKDATEQNTTCLFSNGL